MTATEVIAAHLATDPAVDDELELADQAVGDRAGAGPGRRSLATGHTGQVGDRSAGLGRGRGGGPSVAGRRHAVGSTAISRRGAGTSETTRSTIVSAVIPSARAA